MQIKTATKLSTIEDAVAVPNGERSRGEFLKNRRIKTDWNRRTKLNDRRETLDYLF